jgi:hypothetical protein
MARYRHFDDARTTGEVPVIAPELADVRVRRAGLKTVMSDLEIALAAPAPHRVEWIMGVRGALHALHEMWTRHIVETEAPGAFLDELVSDAPRLSMPASHLRREHSEVLAEIAHGEKRLAAPPALDDDYAEWVEETRVELTKLLAALAGHRQRGADLVYEAYDVDIGGGY